MEWGDFIEEIFFELFPKMTEKYSKNMLIVCKEKKYVLLKYLGKEIKIKCHPSDKFNWEIGFGLALSRIYQKNQDYIFAKKYFTNAKGKLNYKEYAKWCIYENYPDLKDYADIKEKVKKINENGKVDL